MKISEVRSLCKIPFVIISEEKGKNGEVGSSRFIHYFYSPMLYFLIYCPLPLGLGLGSSSDSGSSSSDSGSSSSDSDPAAPS